MVTENNQIIPVILVFRKKNAEHHCLICVWGGVWGSGFHVASSGVFLAIGQNPP